MASFKQKSAFTLIEILIVISLVAMLITIGFPMFGYLRAKAQDVTCVSNLRIMHVGFSTYMQDHQNCWPQVPEAYADSEDESQYWKFWRDSLKDYDVGRKNWICPADAENADALYNVEDDKFMGSYIPTEFDEFPNTPFNWRQPWIVERGENHGKGVGPNLVMPDGSITKGDSILGGK